MISLEQTLAQAWDLLTPPAPGRGRLVSLATVDAEGQPQTRMVMLRQAAREAGTAAVFTDLRSDKVAELRAHPRAAITLWSEADQVQLRLTGQMQISSDDGTLWQSLREDQVLAYGHEPAPGTEIASADAWADAPRPDNLGILKLHVTAIDHVSLDPTGHRRARFHRSDDWVGVWLSP